MGILKHAEFEIVSLCGWGLNLGYGGAVTGKKFQRHSDYVVAAPDPDAGLYPILANLRLSP